MKSRWTLFRITNYFFLVIMFICILSVLRFSVEELNSNESALPLLPEILSFVFIIVNCFFNLHIYYKILPDKNISAFKRSAYITSYIFFILTLLFQIILLIVLYNEELKNNPEESFPYFILSIIFLFLISGLIIIVKQFGIINLLKKQEHQE